MNSAHRNRYFDDLNCLFPSYRETDTADKSLNSVFIHTGKFIKRPQTVKTELKM